MRTMEKEKLARTGMKKSGDLRTLLIIFCLFFASLLSPEVKTQQAAAQDSVGPQVELPTDGALDLARQKVKEDPSSEEARVTLGYLLLKKGSLEEAAKTFDDALALNARLHDALTGKGIVLARMGKDQAAEETLQKALVLNPNPVRTYYELGFLYEKRGDFDKAITEYKRGIEKFKQGRK